MELKTLKGLALHDILTEVHLFVHRGNWWPLVWSGVGVRTSHTDKTSVWPLSVSSSELLLKLRPNS